VGSGFSNEGLEMAIALKVGWFKEYRSGINLIRVILGLLILLAFLFVAQPFIDKMLESFERTAIQQTVRQLDTAINFKIAEYVALDRLQELPEQLNKNPMSWLELDDMGGYDRYLGEVEKLDYSLLKAGHWVFDRATGRLVYKVKYPKRLNNGDPVTDRIQYRLVLEYSDLDEDGQFDADTDKVSGMMMQAEYPYQWLNSAD